MHKGDHCAANDATDGGRKESHHQYQYGEEPAEFVPTQRDKGKEGGACVDEDGGEESPEKYMIPHLAECIETRIRAQTHHIDNAVQLIRVVGFGEHDQISQQSVAGRACQGEAYTIQLFGAVFWKYSMMSMLLVLVSS